MKSEEIRTLLHTQPFVPFTIHLADGRKMRIDHPDFVATAPKSDTLIVYQSDNSFNIVDLTLATDAEVKVPKAK